MKCQMCRHRNHSYLDSVPTSRKVGRILLEVGCISPAASTTPLVASYPGSLYHPLGYPSGFLGHIFGFHGCSFGYLGYQCLSFGYLGFDFLGFQYHGFGYLGFGYPGSGSQTYGWS